ncbi:MAG: hypothetical protein LUD16_08940, partial [Lachnospiraceae bacterium]|nr:hypothetical protein [Lachnospiraceae bacterium]
FPCDFLGFSEWNLLFHFSRNEFALIVGMNIRDVSGYFLAKHRNGIDTFTVHKKILNPENLPLNYRRDCFILLAMCFHSYEIS